MKADDLLFISVGGAAASVAQNIAQRTRRDASQPPMRVLILDTDDAVLQHVTHADGVSVTIFGTQRLSGRGTGGDHILGMSAFRDDAAGIMQQIGSPRLVIVLTCCGGGTSGACEPLLRLLRDRGIANIVFATEPFAFEGEARKRSASVILPTLCETANAVTTVPLASLLAGKEDELTAAQAFDYAADRLAAGICLLWTQLVYPGYIQFDVEHFRLFLERESVSTVAFTFADTIATGDQRAERVVASLLQSPRFQMRGVNCLMNAHQVIVGVLAGDDLRLCELDTLMTGLKAGLGKQAEVTLGTVNHEAFNGKLEVVLLAFTPSGVDLPIAGDALQSVRKRSGKSSRAKALSAVKDRFDDVERTIIDGVNYDTPTYLRRNIRLKR
ncbi:MAG: hypothetical protein IJV69_05415 [Kiritimatiellae bacterium]|nr:hypothetical protein [Kiritimatiellia bacterium]